MKSFSIKKKSNLQDDIRISLVDHAWAKIVGTTRLANLSNFKAHNEKVIDSKFYNNYKFFGTSNKYLFKSSTKGKII
jgi:hypothetical protein